MVATRPMTKEEIQERYGDYGIPQKMPDRIPDVYKHEMLLTDSYNPGASSSDGVAIVSGGLDSVTMAYYLFTQGYSPHLLSFDYGQRHKRELTYALEAAERLRLRWSLIDLSSLTDLISNSALTSPPQPTTKTVRSELTQTPYGGIVTGFEGEVEVEVPEIEVPQGHYAEDNMAITVVPNRNMTMLSIAGAVAVSNKYKYIAAGMHAGDHAQYPDCRPKFLSFFRSTLMYANEGFVDLRFEIKTPWLAMTKNDIAQEAFRLGVQPAWTYSCYEGRPNHCGLCATCTERLEAIASVKHAPLGWDETVYDDNETWKKVVADWKENH